MSENNTTFTTPTLIVPNMGSGGIGVMTNGTFEIVVHIRKTVGKSVYELLFDGNGKGLTRSLTNEAWELAASYLGCEIVVDKVLLKRKPYKDIIAEYKENLKTEEN